MKFFKLLLPIFLFFLVALSVQAVVRTSPEKFEFVVNNKDTRFINDSVTVQVDGEEPVRLRVYVENFDLNENGMISTTQQNGANQLANKIKFNPTEFTVSPGESQKVRFTITDLKMLNNGESRAVIFLEDLKTKTQALQTLNKNVTAQINIKTRMAIPIYVEKGSVTKSGIIEKLSVEKSKDKYTYNLNVKSTGTSKIRVTGVGQILKGKELITEFPVASRPIQSMTTSKFIDILPVQNLDPSQNYTLKVIISFKDQSKKTQTLSKEVNFQVDKGSL